MLPPTVSGLGSPTLSSPAPVGSPTAQQSPVRSPSRPSPTRPEDPSVNSPSSLTGRQESSLPQAPSPSSPSAAPDSDRTGLRPASTASSIADASSAVFGKARAGVAAAAAAAKTTLAQVSPPSAPAASVAPAPKATRPRRTRRARLRISRIDPWSVMKTSLLFGIAGGIIFVVATYVLMSVVEATGLFSAINSVVQSVLSSPTDTTQFDITTYVNTKRATGLAALVGAIDVVIFTALATVFSFLYNLSATMLGGLEITLAED